MNRHARRAHATPALRAAKRARALRTLTVRCGVCKTVVIELPEGQALTTSGQPRPGVQALADSAMRDHCLVTGCVKVEELAPCRLPGRPPTGS